MKLDKLSLTDIVRLCGETILNRGEKYFRSGYVYERMRGETELRATVSGTEDYLVVIKETEDDLSASCTCPYDFHWGGNCKHIAATLLAWVEEPESFRVVGDLRTALQRRDKEELVQILVALCEVYPHLVDEYDLLSEEAGEEYNPQMAVQKIFKAYEPPHGISDEEMLRRLTLIENKAKNFEKAGNYDLARRTYFALMVGCVDCAEDYGSDEMFPETLASDYAERYVKILEKDPVVDGGSEQVKAELKEIERYETAEIMGVLDALWDLMPREE